MASSAIAEIGGGSGQTTAEAEEELSKDADLFLHEIKSGGARMFANAELEEEEAERSPLKRLVNSGEFQYFILLLVVLGAVIAGVQTSKTYRHNSVLHVLDLVILGIFAVEAVLRMASDWPEPQKYFLDGWNVFDFTIVFFGFVDVIIQAAGVELGGGANCLVVLRLFRLLRLLKMMRAIPQLQLLATTLLNSMPSMMWMCVPLLLIFYVFGCIGCFLFQKHDPRFFGNLGRSMVTLFQITTLDSWNYIMYIEMYGCSEYYDIRRTSTNTAATLHTLARGGPSACTSSCSS